ncbi:MAG: TetR/AcrR family transcriptional regulator [Kineosporiaceae bacterium]|nr:TetR/AcrR family transcriptional regulator [Kineosporiaceae bacterium]
MPRVVDHEARRRAIANVALMLLARDGAAGLSLRNIATEMGGSLTMVTHYYANRQALMTDLAHQICDTWQATLDEIDESHHEPRDRLRTFMAWLLPLTPRGHEEERARFALLAADNDPDCRAVLLDFDNIVRELLRQRLHGLVPRRRVAAVADLLRAFASGVVLDAQLSPQAWPAKRQLALLDDLLAALLPH